MKSKTENRSNSSPKRSGVGLAIAVGLLWAATIGVTWYFYQKNDTDGGLATFFGRFHILAVHVPIGLIFLVPLMEMAGWTRAGKKVKEAVPFVLWMAVLTAAMASFLGFLMMNAEDIAGRWMTLHMWTGLAVGVFAVLALVFKLARVGFFYAVTLLAAIGATAGAGHFGGAMIHSPEYLSEHAPERVKPVLELGLTTGSAERGTFDELLDALMAFTGAEEGEEGAAAIPEGEPGTGEATTEAEESAEAEVSIPDLLVFEAFVQPILDAKCTQCHSEEKIKGKLRLDTHAMIMAGAEGTDYPTIIPGDAETSELIARVLMPEDDDLFMPPEGKDKLTESEIEVLKWWILGGAKEEGTVAELSADDQMLATLAAVTESLASGEEVEVVVDADPTGVWPTLGAEEQQARLDGAYAAAKEGGFSILPISAEDDRLRVSAVNASATFGDDQIAALEPVAERVVWLDLGRTQVSDKGMASIGQMKNLERLHLEQTKITDGGAKHFATLTNLEYLNLYGTEVTAAIFEPLSSVRNLRKLFLWETKVDHAAARQFQRQMSLEVNTGWEVAAVNVEVDEPAEEAIAEPESKSELKPEPEPKPKAEPKPEAAPKADKATPTKPAADPKTAAAKPATPKPEAKPEPATPKPPTVEAPKPQPKAKDK